MLVLVDVLLIFDDGVVILLFVLGLLLLLFVWCLDVIVVEYELQVMCVNIGVVCVVFFLCIVLMSVIGLGSIVLYDLLLFGMGVWLVILNVMLLFVDGGCNWLNFVFVYVQCDEVFVQYEKIMQCVFCDVFDVFVVCYWFVDQVVIEWVMFVFQVECVCLVKLCYDSGVICFLEVFDV